MVAMGARGRACAWSGVARARAERPRAACARAEGQPRWSRGKGDVRGRRARHRQCAAWSAARPKARASRGARPGGSLRRRGREREQLRRRAARRSALCGGVPRSSVEERR
eukprot:scaffold171044_cov30-Tisochrysis_lutea.AAC.1